MVFRAKRSSRKNQARLKEEFRQTAQDFLEEGKKPLSIALIYNADSPTEAAHSGDGAICTIKTADHDAQRPKNEQLVRNDEFVQREAQALHSLGHEVECRGLCFQDIDLIKNVGGDFVFNLCEGTGLDGDVGLEAVCALEAKPIAFSGVGSGPYRLTTDKQAMKEALKRAFLPVPSGAVVGHRRHQLPEGLRYPLIVKPRFGFGSLGIGDSSVVWDKKKCRRICDKLICETGIDVIVEEYIEGREVTVGIIGNNPKAIVLPPAELHFGSAYQGKPNIRTYETKWNESSPLYWGFTTLCPAPLSAELISRVEQTALAAYFAVGADGYGRVDIRLTADGIPYVLEVNANCSLENAEDEHDSAEVPLIARAMGWSYPELMACIVGAGKLRPIRPYKAARMVLRRENNQIVGRVTTNMQKGMLIQAAGYFSAAAPGTEEKYLLADKADLPLWPEEPSLRFIAHSSRPNAVLQWSRGQLWLAACRSMRAGEELCLDRTAPLEISAPVLGTANEAGRRKLPKRSISATQL